MQMVQIMAGLIPILEARGIPFNMKTLLEDWFEAEGIKDVDRYFEMDEQQAQMQQLALMQRQNEAMQGLPPGDLGAGGGGRLPAGTPNRGTAKPPGQMINPANSGMLPSRDY
jgi:hypothetical protein